MSIFKSLFQRKVAEENNDKCRCKCHWLKLFFLIQVQSEVWQWQLQSPWLITIDSAVLVLNNAWLHIFIGPPLKKTQYSIKKKNVFPIKVNTERTMFFSWHPLFINALLMQLPFHLKFNLLQCYRIRVSASPTFQVP